MRHGEDPEPMLAEGRWDGTIIDAPRGDGGFGYDPYFLDAETGLTGAELPVPTKAPNCGQDSDQVMRDVLGYDDAKIAALRSDEILY